VIDVFRIKAHRHLAGLRGGRGGDDGRIVIHIGCRLCFRRGWLRGEVGGKGLLSHVLPPFEVSWKIE
jgi:hypothetical protein